MVSYVLKTHKLQQKGLQQFLSEHMFKVILELLDFMYIVQDDLKQITQNTTGWFIPKVVPPQFLQTPKVNWTPP